MTRPAALFATTNYWTSPFQVGSHHLARELLRRGWRVAFVSDPVSPLHLIGGDRRDLRDRIALYRGGGRQLDGGPWTYVPGALLTPNNRFPLRGRWLQRRWADLTVPDVVTRVRRAGFGDVDMLYFDDSNAAFWMDRIRHRRSVFRIHDYGPAFAKHTAAKQAQDERLAAAVDLVVYTAASLEPYVRSLGAGRTLHVPNGVDAARFAEDASPRPPEYASMQGPVAVYVGLMEAPFDTALVAAAAEALPSVQLVMIGPPPRRGGERPRRANLHWLGARDYARLPAYLRHAGVGIVPFDTAGDRVFGVDSQKVLQYLASGLPVVSMAWEELRRRELPVTLCDDADQFVEGIRRALASPPDRAALVARAARENWRGRLSMVLDALGLESPGRDPEPGPVPPVASSRA